MHAFPPNFIINVKCFCGGCYSQVLQTPLKSSEVESILNWSSLLLLWKDDGVGARFLLLKLINRRFSRESHYKKFPNIFSASLNCLYNFVVAAGILHPKSCVLFLIFFSVTLLSLSYIQGKFRTSSAIRSSEAATCMVL